MAERILNGTARLTAIPTCDIGARGLPQLGKLVKEYLTSSQNLHGIFIDARRLLFRPCVFQPGLPPARRACNARRWSPAPASRRSDSDAVPQTVWFLRFSSPAWPRSFFCLTWP